MSFAVKCRDAAQLFLGRHDFTQFANTFPHEVDPTKTIRRFTVTEMPTALIRLEVEGSGFLFRMVRHMVCASNHTYAAEDMMSFPIILHQDVVYYGFLTE